MTRHQQQFGVNMSFLAGITKTVIKKNRKNRHQGLKILHALLKKPTKHCFNDKWRKHYKWLRIVVCASLYVGCSIIIALDLSVKLDRLSCLYLAHSFWGSLGGFCNLINFPACFCVLLFLMSSTGCSPGCSAISQDRSHICSVQFL